MEMEPQDWAKMFNVRPNNHNQIVVPSGQFVSYTGQSYSIVNHSYPIPPQSTTCQPNGQTYVLFPRTTTFSRIQSPVSTLLPPQRQFPLVSQTPVLQIGQELVPATQSCPRLVPVTPTSPPLVPEMQGLQRLVFQGSQIHHVTPPLETISVESSKDTFEYLKSISRKANICISSEGATFASPVRECSAKEDGVNVDHLIELLDEAVTHLEPEPMPISNLDSSSVFRMRQSVNISSDSEPETMPANATKTQDIEEVETQFSLSTNHALALGLTPTGSINKPTVWLNATLQLDTGMKLKNGQPTTQYRSLITNIVTRLVYPSNMCPPEDTETLRASMTYDERGRITVIRVDFITAGIFQVICDKDSKLHPTYTRSLLKSAILKRVKSIDNLIPGSQHVVLGDLCPVPRGVQKCHRNAKPLCRKLMEHVYCKEFRKYTLPLLVENGEEDVWTNVLKVPRTRSRVSDYDDLATGQQSLKRKSPSPTSVTKESECMEDKSTGNKLPRKKRRRCLRSAPTLHSRLPGSSPTTPTSSPSSSPPPILEPAILSQTLQSNSSRSPSTLHVTSSRSSLTLQNSSLWMTSALQARSSLSMPTLQDRSSQLQDDLPRLTSPPSLCLSACSMFRSSDSVAALRSTFTGLPRVMCFRPISPTQITNTDIDKPKLVVSNSYISD